MDPPEECQEPAATVNFEEATEEGEGHSRGRGVTGREEEREWRRATGASCREELAARGGKNEAR
jgi:hypothetical protein